MPENDRALRVLLPEEHKLDTANLLAQNNYTVA